MVVGDIDRHDGLVRHRSKPLRNFDPGEEPQISDSGLRSPQPGRIERIAFDHAKLAERWDPVVPDENVPYYLRRLEEITKKFEPFFTPRDFKMIFSPEDLFGFSEEGISILTRPVDPGESGEADEIDDEKGAREPKIWLDLGE